MSVQANPQACIITVAITGSLRLHVQFVMGVKNALPVDRAAFEFFVSTPWPATPAEARSILSL
jgi:hypothetical protein